MKAVLFAAWIVTFPNGEEKQFTESFYTFENIEACEKIRKAWISNNLTPFQQLVKDRKLSLMCEIRA